MEMTQGLKWKWANQIDGWMYISIRVYLIMYNTVRNNLRSDFPSFVCLHCNKEPLEGQTREKSSSNAPSLCITLSDLWNQCCKRETNTPTAAPWHSLYSSSLYMFVLPASNVAFNFKHLVSLVFLIIIIVLSSLKFSTTVCFSKHHSLLHYMRKNYCEVNE